MQNHNNSTQGSACDPESAGGLYIEKPKHFRRKFVGRITSFRPECGHTLKLDPNEWGVDSDLTIKFMSLRGKKQLRRASRKNVDFIDEERRGNLFLNGHGVKRGWGDGGLFAILKGKPDLGTEHFEFAMNDSEFN